ncbi:MAG: DUF502 domain-containing protein [Candidatus Sumerlaeia bacterium]|nr:DUF502 domain-containing protein [Candidatus Sumerlaeia bacterium]
MIVPVYAAVWAVMLVFAISDSLFGDYVRHGARSAIDPEGEFGYLIGTIVSVFSLAIAFGVIVGIGWLSKFLVVKELIQIGERFVTRIPVVKFFYITPKEVIQTLTQDRGASYKRVVMIQYPARGFWCVAFATNEVHVHQGEDAMVAVFMPTTPNPTTGFLMFYPVSDVLDTDLTLEDGFRMIMSGGILSPGVVRTRPYQLGRLHAPDEETEVPDAPPAPGP